MSGDDRSKNASSVIIGTFYGILLLSTCFLLYILGDLNGRQAERRGKIPAEYSKSSKLDVQRLCAGGVPNTVFECIQNEAKESLEYARAEQELSAQQRAADSALGAVVVALFTLIVTAIGVWLVKRTLDATLIAVEDTSKATDAMVQQNMLAERAQRAWITVDIRPVMFSPEVEGWEFIFDAVFKNIGQSATEFHASCERFHPAVRERIQGVAIDRVVPEHGIPILPNEEIALRTRVAFPKEKIFLVPWIIATVIYIAENKRCVGSYVFRIEKKADGIIWGGNLIGPEEIATADQIYPKRENHLTVIA